jgi:membrane-associated protease RseP (regulator of RpoE activity)
VSNEQGRWPPVTPGVSPSGLERMPVDLWAAPPTRPKFQHRYWLHILLFVLTLGTATLQPVWQVLASGFVPTAEFFTLERVLSWFWYSVPVLVILGAHEFGHYGFCRRYDVDATLPYFLPAPLPITGTFGAVIRIRQAFPSKRALFDIGVAGPIAGFIALLPFLYFGVRWSEVAPVPEGPVTMYFGEPLLFKAIARLQFGTLPEGHDIFLHPMGMAAWVGMLATALNLLPFGQLDGGHLVYSVLGRRASWVSLATIAAAIGLTLRSSSWTFVTVMMVVMAVLLGLRHPRVIDEDTPLDPVRQLIFVFAIVMFVLCFTPVPVEIFLK